MTTPTEQFQNAVALGASDNMRERQDPLMAHYKQDPKPATIIDSAATSSERVSAATPIYGQVIIGDSGAEPVNVGVHKAVGGRSDFPNPGEILSAAIAACLDSTIRIITNRMNVRLRKLEVTVDAVVDVRGTLLVDPTVPVGFQKILVDVSLEPEGNVPEQMMQAILKAAEHSCVVIQTLRGQPEISVTSKTGSNQASAA